MKGETMIRKVIAHKNLPFKLNIPIFKILILYLAFREFGVVGWLQGVIYTLYAIIIFVTWFGFFTQECIDIFED